MGHITPYIHIYHLGKKFWRFRGGNLHFFPVEVEHPSVKCTVYNFDKKKWNFPNFQTTMAQQPHMVGIKLRAFLHSWGSVESDNYIHCIPSVCCHRGKNILKRVSLKKKYYKKNQKIKNLTSNLKKVPQSPTNVPHFSISHLYKHWY